MDKLSQTGHYYKDSYDGSTCEISRQWYDEAKAKLAAYEDLEEQGRFVVLPADGIQANTDYNGWTIASADFGSELKRIEIVTLVRTSYVPEYLAELTRAEAESALKAGEADGKGGAV